VQERSRPMTRADISKGIDLSKLAIDASNIPVPNGPDLQPEEIEAFVDDFFNALDAVNEYDEDGSSERPSEDELAALDAQANPETLESPTYDQNVIELVEPSAEELVDMMDEIYHADEGMNEAEMLAAMAGEDDSPEYPDWLDDAPILDLSVLEKPVASKEDREL